MFRNINIMPENNTFKSTFEFLNVLYLNRRIDMKLICFIMDLQKKIFKCYNFQVLIINNVRNRYQYLIFSSLYICSIQI